LIIDSINKQNMIYKSNTQESLQPQKLDPEDKAYQSVLVIEERLKKEDATNIALTGPYGSGKSSVLKSINITK